MYCYFTDARLNVFITTNVSHLGNSVELDVERTNLEMDVYRQALSVVGEQLLPTRESTQYCKPCVSNTLTQNSIHIRGCLPAVTHPNMHQFIIKINVSFLEPSSSHHPKKTEPTEVISLLSISLTHSRSVHCRGTGAFAVLWYACGKVKIREREQEFDGQLMK